LRRAGGFTLIEMLVVIALLSTLMALAAGAWLLSKKRFEAEGAAAQIEVTIRQARNNALFSGTPAFVEFDTERGEGKRPRVIPWGYQLVAMYHFEDGNKQTSGGRGNRAFLNNCIGAEGKIGRAVATGYLRGRQGVRGYVECLPNPDYDCEDGGFLEAYIYMEFENGQPQYVFRKPDCYALFVTGKGFLAGRVGMQTAEADEFLLPLRRWMKVGMAWDHLSIRLMVQDAIVAVAEGDETPINDEPLFIGDPDGAILGRIDEARVLAAVRGQPFELPPNAKLVHNAAPWGAAFFAHDGTLGCCVLRP
jgi:prepilin-type N-terminal cleavage/methylation domain-containing protein